MPRKKYGVKEVKDEVEVKKEKPQQQQIKLKGKNERSN